MKTYSEKLQDPQWQRKRLEIMQRDNFECQYCWDTESKLNVHHRYYVSGREPWNYPKWSLVTVCDSCHRDYHANNAINHMIYEWFIEFLSDGNYTEDFTKSMAAIMNAKTESEKIEIFTKLNKTRLAQ